MKIKQTPVLTSQNYGINYVEIDDVLMNCFGNANYTLKFNNDINSQITDTGNEEIILKNIFDTKSHQKYDFSKKIIINQNLKSPIFVDLKNFKNLALAGKIEFAIHTEKSVQIVIKLENIETLSQIFTLSFNLEKSSTISAIILCDSTNSNAELINFQFDLKENAKADVNMVSFSSKNSVQNVNFNLLGDNSKATFNNLYLGFNNDNLNMNYVMNVSGKSCHAQIKSIGVLCGNCQKNYVGTINFEKGSTKSVGDESENCILLSSKARSKSTPILLSKEDDATGTHSASVQNIDVKKLFYVATRGLSKTDATKIFVSAKIKSFLNNFFEENIKNEIDKKIEMRLENENI